MAKPAVPPSTSGGDGPLPIGVRDLAAWDDAALLRQFVAQGDQAAFAEIACRYGPMVFRACLRQLANEHDAEDATQAVFLVLARQPRKAQGSLAGWLHKVAHDTSVTLLRAKARRARREEVVAMRKAAEQPTTPGRNDAAPLAGLREDLDSSIARLPTRLRAPVILCYVEGHRQEEAARILGCNQGTLSRRAADGLNLLRSLLQRRGVVVTSAALVAFFAQQKAQAAVPATLLGSLKLAAAGKVLAAGALSTQAGALADATLKAAALAKMKIAAGIVLAVTALGAATAVVSLRPAAPDAMTFLNFDGPVVPTNGFGDLYPSSTLDAGDGGVFSSSINTLEAIRGGSLQMRLTMGRWKAEFMPEEKGGKKTFARDYAAAPASWRFNTYNRFRFWLKAPPSSAAHSNNGGSNMSVGTYVKRVHNPSPSSLDEGGGSYFHRLNVPRGEWVQITLNMHPHVHTQREVNGDPGNMPHPTNEPDCNYFDALTRFYIEARDRPSAYPADYLLDEMEFFREPYPENDGQVYSIAATYRAARNRLIVTWSRPPQEDGIRHEVRYAFANVHKIGWERATPAPGGIVSPQGKGLDSNGMIYDTNELPLAGQPLVYIAIKPTNANVFSQVAVPLTRK